MTQKKVHRVKTTTKITWDFSAVLFHLVENSFETFHRFALLSTFASVTNRIQWCAWKFRCQGISHMSNLQFHHIANFYDDNPDSGLCFFFFFWLNLDHWLCLNPLCFDYYNADRSQNKRNESHFVETILKPFDEFIWHLCEFSGR